MSDTSPLDSATPAENAAFFSPDYLEKRRRALELMPGPRDLDEGDSEHLPATRTQFAKAPG